MLNETDELLVETARSAAARLARVRGDLDDDRFAGLAYDVALSQLKFEMNRHVYDSVRSRFEANRDAYLARLGRALP